MGAERVIEKGTYVSPSTGIMYDTTAVQLIDACAKCGGDGSIRYSTISDLRDFIAARNEWRDHVYEDDEEDEDYYPELLRSASRPCERCNGTGTFKGDGGAFTLTMTSQYTINNP